MAIRNNKLGGEDFVNGEVLYDYDLDDTFNAVVDKMLPLQENIAENAINIAVLQYTNSVTDIPHDYIQVDVFSNADGYNNTVNTTDTTSCFNASYYKNTEALLDNPTVTYDCYGYSSGSNAVYSNTAYTTSDKLYACSYTCGRYCKYAYGTINGNFVMDVNYITRDLTFWTCMCICTRYYVRSHVRNSVIVSDSNGTSCSIVSHNLCKGYGDCNIFCSYIDNICIMKTDDEYIKYFVNSVLIACLCCDFHFIRLYNYSCSGDSNNTCGYGWVKSYLTKNVNGYLNSTIQTNEIDFEQELKTFYLTYDGVLENNTSIDVDIYDSCCGLLYCCANTNETITLPNNTGKIYSKLNQRTTCELNKSCIKSYAILVD